jgi:hypothetical protein
MEMIPTPFTHRIIHTTSGNIMNQSQTPPVQTQYIEFIRAWALGEPVQYWVAGANEWDDLTPSQVSRFAIPSQTFRLKPKPTPAYYRLFLTTGGENGSLRVATANLKDKESEYELKSHFIRWLSPKWIKTPTK